MNSHSKRQAGRTGSWLQALMALILGAMLLAAGPARAATETITYIHGDISGSPLAATNATGAVVWKESYRAYGERWVNDPGSAQQSQWFHGKEQDAATGLQYFGARYYDPAVGRFLGIDPVDYLDGNLHSFNRYAYGNNNPVRYADPDGRIAIPLIYLGGAALATASVALLPPEQRNRMMQSGYRAAQSVGDALDRARQWMFNDGGNDVGASALPPVPEGLVGDQSDLRAGTSASGKRHTSGPLLPEHGGTGDANQDFDRLTGGTGRPFPASDNRSKIPGARVGDNGIWIRPGTKNPGDGPRIEVPGNENKPPETLHY